MTPEARTEYIVGCIREAGSMYPEDAAAFLAEHDANRRAEVRREVLTETTAMACANCCGPIDWINCPTGGWWAHRQHPADGHDASPIPAASLDDGAPPPAGETTQPADFFQPDQTYQRRRWVFQCLAVAPNPFNGETRAVGYLYRPGEPATATALDPDDWAHGGWTCADSADRFPYLGTAPRDAVAYRSPTSGRLYCRQCCTRLGVWANLTCEDLPDGGICARCGIDVLIDPPLPGSGEAL